MLCCLLIALFGSPALLWAGQRTAKGQDCCADNRRTVLMISAAALVGLCSAMLLLGWLQPAPFRHICSLLTPR